MTRSKHSENVWRRLENAVVALRHHLQARPGDPELRRLAYAPRPATQAEAEALLEEMSAYLG